MKKPNFFIVGAPKCGTTSLASWLSEHPQIYMSPRKEPHHFNTDQNHIIIKERKNYEQLFHKATSEHLAVGEASTGYLYSQIAVKNIEQYSPNARYIVCLRNPIEMAYSFHEQLIFNGDEHILDFPTAWSLNDARLRGEDVSIWCREPRRLAYGDACKLGTQMARLYKQIPEERVMPVLLDDVKSDPKISYQRVLHFLHVEDDNRSEFPAKNPAKERQSLVLHRLIQLAGHARRIFGTGKTFGVLNSLSRKNVKYRSRAPMSDEMSQILKKYFYDDITLLSEILKRDLSHWITQQKKQ